MCSLLICKDTIFKGTSILTNKVLWGNSRAKCDLTKQIVEERKQKRPPIGDLFVKRVSIVLFLNYWVSSYTFVGCYFENVDTVGKVCNIDSFCYALNGFFSFVVNL